ncbi:hypothetical protein LZ30DRAFT_728618 [Colletotrichum cereale]|nr:hypothetical protein LZ30DRAFT_728618 [Colletotrichum cereale]
MYHTYTTLTTDRRCTPCTSWFLLIVSCLANLPTRHGHGMMSPVSPRGAFASNIDMQADTGTFTDVQCGDGEGGRGEETSMSVICGRR